MKNKLFSFLLMLVLPVQCFAEDVADNCYSQLFSMPDLMPIAKKMGFPDISKATFEQLANTDKATDKEKPLISKFAEGVKICSDLEMDLQPKPLHPKAKKREEDYANSRLTLLIDLYNQKISYGEFIKIRQGDLLKRYREWEELKIEMAEQEQIDSENNAKIKAMQDAQRRQALSDAFGNISNAIRNSRPPRAINCMSDGLGGVRCQ